MINLKSIITLITVLVLQSCQPSYNEQVIVEVIVQQVKNEDICNKHTENVCGYHTLNTVTNVSIDDFELLSPLAKKQLYKEVNELVGTKRDNCY